jgi:hypothetical protein
MAIAFKGAAEYDSATNQRNHTITLPTNANGDLVIIHLQGTGAGSLNWETTPSGWTELVPDTGSGGTATMGAAQIWYKIVGTSEPNPQWGFFEFGDLTVRANSVSYSGTASTLPFDNPHTTWTGNTGSSTSPTSASVTTTTTNTMVLRFLTHDDEDSTEGTVFPGGTTNRAYQEHASPSNGGGFAIAESGIQASAGATGVATWTLDLADGWGAITIPIRDAANDPVIVTKDFTMDSVFANLFLKDTNFDAVLQGVFTKDVTFDAILQFIATGDIQMDAVLKKEGLQKDFTFDADLRILVANTLTCQYDMVSFIANTLSNLYDIRNLVNNENTFIYGLGGLVANTLTVLSDIHVLISNTLTSIQSTLDYVSNTLTGRWNITQFISNTLTSIQSTLDYVSNTSTLKYNILNHISNTGTFLYDILPKFTKIQLKNARRKIKLFR